MQHIIGIEIAVDKWQMSIAIRQVNDVESYWQWQISVVENDGIRASD
jgi:hypothetical protein